MLKNLDWQNSFVIHLRPTEGIVNPKHLLADHHIYINQLFALLSQESARFVNDIWELLMVLPSNQQIMENIDLLNIPNSTVVRIAFY